MDRNEWPDWLPEAKGYDVEWSDNGWLCVSGRGQRLDLGAVPDNARLELHPTSNVRILAESVRSRAQLRLVFDHLPRVHVEAGFRQIQLRQEPKSPGQAKVLLQGDVAATIDRAPRTRTASVHGIQLQTYIADSALGRSRHRGRRSGA